MSSLRHARRFLASCFVVSALATGCTATAPVGPARPGHTQVSLDRAKVRAKLAARRAQSFQRFLAYRDAAIYPLNNLPGGGFRHVWVDDAGNLCAAATLISGDWGRDATARIAEENLELKLADVTSGPILDWMLTSGLTHHELVAIQVPGWQGPEVIRDGARDAEIARLFQIYVDVERQLTSLWEEGLDAATDALMRHPALARELMRDQVAGPGRFAVDHG